MNVITTMSSNVKFDVIKGDLVKTYDRFFSVFLAQSHARGYGGIVMGTETVPNADEVETGDEKITILNELNIKAFSALVTATLQNDRAFNIVKDTKGDDYPNGNVQTALYELKKEFTESTMITKRKMTKAFLRTKKYKRGTNPVKELEKLITLRRALKRHNVEKTLKDCYEVVIERLPRECKNVKFFLQCKLNKGSLTYDNITQQLTIRYDELEEEEDSNEETTES